MNPLLAALAASSLSDFDGGRPSKSTSPEVLCMTLREVAERYDAPCPFKVGDLVTLRAGSTYRGAGSPHIVIEVPGEPIRTISSTPRDSVQQVFGARLDFRVACETDGHIAAFWQESWQFEPYTGPGSQPEEAKAA